MTVQGSGAACGFLVGAASLGALKSSLFASAPTTGLRAARMPATVGPVAPLGGGQPAGTTVDGTTWRLGCAAAAAALAGGGAKAANAGRRRQRAVHVATKALGSIEQFKVFGPKEDPFVIETDKVLGIGGQGTVYLCHRESDPATKYAVKTIPIWRLLMDPSSAEKIAEIRKEVDVLLRIQGHPNVCECIGCYDAFRPGTSEAQYIMMVMEKIDGGELAAYIKDGHEYLDEATAKSVLKQTVLGLKHIHDVEVVHRDLKAENILVCGQELTPSTEVKLIDFGVAKAISNTIARSCVGTTEIMAPELVSAKLMMAPKGVKQERHGPYTFKPPTEASPGFGIVSQRPDGKGAMVNGIEPGGQAEAHGVDDGWAIGAINGTDITEMPFIKDFNEIGAGTKAGVTAIAEILGSLNADFTMEFVELPKREFSKRVDMWSLGCVLYQMLGGVTPFKNEEDIVNGVYDEGPIAHCSDDARALVRSLLHLDPNMRPLLEEVLSHPWLA